MENPKPETRNPKSEIRNPKSESNPNDRNPKLRIWDLGFLSDFVIRISDLRA
jgi:hypothetical protein